MAIYFGKIENFYNLYIVDKYRYFFILDQQK